MAKRLAGSYIDKIYDTVRARDDINRALEYVRETINDFYVRMEKAENLNEELLEIILMSEKAVKTSDSLDLIEISEWLKENDIDARMISTDGGYVFVFHTTQDAVFFTLKWSQ